MRESVIEAINPQGGMLVESEEGKEQKEEKSGGRKHCQKQE